MQPSTAQQYRLPTSSVQQAWGDEDATMGVPVPLAIPLAQPMYAEPMYAPQPTAPPPPSPPLPPSSSSLSAIPASAAVLSSSSPSPAIESAERRSAMSSSTAESESDYGDDAIQMAADEKLARLISRGSAEARDRELLERSSWHPATRA
jgi:hypothetical protein